YKLREIARICEVGFAVRHRAHLFHELNEVVVAGQHERVDHYTGFSTSLDFFERRLHNKRVATHRILVKTTSRNRIPAGLSLLPCCSARRDRQGRRSYALNEASGRLAVSEHYDLLHLFALRLQNPARQAQHLG